VKKDSLFIILDYVLAAIFLAGIIYVYEVRMEPSAQLYVQPSIRSSISSSAPAPLSLLFARTDAERSLGLGDRQSLPADEGMLFVFDQPGYYGFWMKDMHFPIDMIWLDADFRIVRIAADVATSSYPAVFSPDSPSSYVLETDAGYAAANGLAPGETLDFVRDQMPPERPM
jgi:uncharacterized membrane protein (UPF0127 family)